MTESESEVSSGPYLLLAIQVVIEGNRPGVSRRIQILLRELRLFMALSDSLDSLTHITVL